jgi:hypothetical protein
MSEPYTLPFRLSEAELKDLNAGQSDKDDKLYSPEFRFAIFMRNREGVMSLDWIHKVIKACRSGKKIVNPMSPAEELRILRDAYAGPVDVTALGAVKGEKLIDNVVEIIAKEHPDVKDWLGDKDACST